MALKNLSSDMNVSQKRPVAERNRNPGNRHDSEHGHLKACLKQTPRSPNQHRQRCGSKGVQGHSVMLAREQARQQEHGRHGERTLRRLAEARKRGVGACREQRSCRRKPGRQVQTTQQPEDSPGEKRDMEPGNDEQVKGSGPLKAGPKAVVQAGPIAEEHRVEHLRIRLSKP